MRCQADGGSSQCYPTPPQSSTSLHSLPGSRFFCGDHSILSRNREACHVHRRGLVTSCHSPTLQGAVSWLAWPQRREAAGSLEQDAHTHTPSPQHSRSPHTTRRHVLAPTHTTLPRLLLVALCPVPLMTHTEEQQEENLLLNQERLAGKGPRASLQGWLLTEVECAGPWVSAAPNSYSPGLTSPSPPCSRLRGMIQVQILVPPLVTA